MTGNTNTRGASLRFNRAARRSMLLLAAAFVCAGCSLSTKKEKDGVTGSLPIDYRHRHPIAIKEGSQSMEVFVGARRGGLTPTQRGEVAAFAGEWKREATGGIAIDVPSGTPNARAAAEIAREMRGVLAQAGVPPQAILARSYRAENPYQLATVRMRYPKMTAQAGPCGLWPQDLGLAHDASPTLNRPYWNLGCANQRNLAAMVDNPADLVQPRAETPIYSARRSIAVDKYRKGESSATVYPEANKGKISDVAQ